MPPLNILCLSHLAWQKHLFQRPQQLMREMSQRGHRVVYVGCVGMGESARYKERGELAGVVAGEGAGFVSFVNSSYSAVPGKVHGLRRLVARRLVAMRRRMNFTKEGKDVLWIYHPSLAKIGNPASADLTVYDAMDRFDAFAASHPGVVADEKKLIGEADLLFTGGRSLQEHVETISRHASATETPISCFASGVDLEHFCQAQHTGKLPVDVVALSKPILGYFGALDERIDFDLLRAIAVERPQWSVVLIGPQLTAPGPLPPNIHLLGARDYDQLPYYLAAFDVALLPFKQTNLVAHISPTKTPEYLAGGKPVVSTPIPDVQRNFGDVVSVATNTPDFLAACDKAIESPREPGRLIAAATERARTWEQIAALMETAILEQLEKKQRG